MNPELKSHFESLLGSRILESRSVSGGDIATASIVETATHRYFVKTSPKPWAEELFASESRSLQKLELTQTIKVPKVLSAGYFQGTGYLILEYVESKRPNKKDFESLGHKLAELHLAPQTNAFGATQNNFIGDLPQSNTVADDWALFYTEQRLIPQLQLAKTRGLLYNENIPSKAGLIEVCSSLMSEIRPSLLHGDLWGGNFLIAIDGTPVLIDPSSYVGHSEVDLAMSRLFRGFEPSFYSAYHELIPPHPRQKELIEIYQLYYLLAHLNMFGNSYKKSVLVLLNKYFIEYR